MLGKEFGTCTSRSAKVRSLLFERAPRLFDFLVFALQPRRCVRQAAEPLLELLVGLLASSFCGSAALRRAVGIVQQAFVCMWLRYC